MNQTDEIIFSILFKECYQKCFNKSLVNAISEPESKFFSKSILDQTGLIVGWKSIKNYSQFIVKETARKDENPTTATLDTFARYLASVPKTDEAARKRTGTNSYWYEYRDHYLKTNNIPESDNSNSSVKSNVNYLFFAAVVVLILGSVFIYRQVQTRKSEFDFIENFTKVSDNDLESHGWKIKNVLPDYWTQKNSKPEHVTLFTLQGDNYPDSLNRIGIPNLVYREIPGSCFSTEIYFSEFIPGKNWQQAGLLLSDDTSINSKSLRLSISYNDYFGGYAKAPEIIIQALSNTTGSGKPDELLHYNLFTLDGNNANLIQLNLHKSALRIRKDQNKFSFLYGTGIKEIFAFKEMLMRELNFNPKYIGIFAISGNTDHPDIKPVHIDLFRIKSDCE